jgi:hypothetical protein
MVLEVALVKVLYTITKNKITEIEDTYEPKEAKEFQPAYASG